MIKAKELGKKSGYFKNWIKNGKNITPKTELSFWGIFLNSSEKRSILLCLSKEDLKKL